MFCVPIGRLKSWPWPLRLLKLQQKLGSDELGSELNSLVFVENTTAREIICVAVVWFQNMSLDKQHVLSQTKSENSVPFVGGSSNTRDRDHHMLPTS